MIGIFDSGIGGLSIYLALKQLMPQVSCMYYADHLHFPYGEKTMRQIIEYTAGISNFLIEQGSDLIVVACNTATISSIQYLRKTFQVPFIGTVPAIKPACLHSKTKKVAVLLTHTAARGNVFHDLLSSWAKGVEVKSIRTPTLVEISEKQLQDTPRALTYLHSILDPLQKAGFDSLVLGSTHFVFLKSWIQRIYSDQFQIYDPAEGVARQTQRILDQLPALSHHQGDVFFTSGNLDEYRTKLKMLVGDHIPIESIKHISL